MAYGSPGPLRLYGRGFAPVRGLARSHRSDNGPGEGIEVLQDAERQALIEVLQAKHWHLTRVAEHLGISRNTLYRKLRKHGITRGD